MATAESPDVVLPAWRWLLHRTPITVWAVCGLHLTVALGWSLLAPVWDAPDEPQHADLARGVVAEGSYFEYDERFLSQQVTESFVVMEFSDTGSAHNRTRGPVTAIEALPRTERPSFSELAPDEPASDLNPAPQHPPLYYALLALVLLALPDGAIAFDLTVWSLRLVSVLLATGVPWLTYWAARSLTGHHAWGITAALLPLAVPQYTHIAGVVSNDPLLTLQFSVLLLTLIFVARGDRTLRTAAWVGATAGAALLTKGFALVLPAWITAAYLLGLARSRDLRGIMRSAALTAGLSLVIGGWWWLRNVVVHGTVQTTTQNFPDADPTAELTFAIWFDRVGGHFVDRFWGSFGWVAVTLDEHIVVWAAWTTTLLIALGFAIRRSDDRWTRWDLAVIIVALPAILAVVAYGSYEKFAQSGHLTGMQGRYLFAALPAMAVIAAIGLHQLLRPIGRWLPLLALGLLAMMQWFGASTVLFHYYNQSGAPLESLRISGAALLAWAPVDAPVTIGVLLAVVLAGLLVAATIVRDALARSVATGVSTTAPGTRASLDGKDTGMDDANAVEAGGTVRADAGAGMPPRLEDGVPEDLPDGDDRPRDEMRRR
jgi:small subunit ribosomal protein S36